MADYIYLLETRLSPAQQRAIGTVRGIARENDLTVFLTGGAVRDLTGGGSVRDLDLTIQGDAFRLKQPLEATGAITVGEDTQAQRLFLSFPGNVRVEVSSAMRVTYATPGKPVYEPGNISEDLRSRDFTANAMAISLNQGSYGLLMDPLNGVADIENRELRLVNNYGFIEEPSRLIRAARLLSRLGWQMEERTRQRYDTAKDENYISALDAWHRGYEIEEIFHEEDPLRVLRALESEGWSGHLFPALQTAKANAAGLSELADRQGQLQIQGIVAQSAALAFPLMTAKLAAADIAVLKGLIVRPGFIAQVESLETQVREFATRIGGKEAATPSAAWKLLHEAEPNLVLAVYSNNKNPNVQARLKTFLNDSPAARQRIPYALLQELRITSDLPEYNDLLDRLFFELMDGKLATVEEMKAFLEPYSPPAPPPPINLRRAKAKKEARPSRAKAKKSTEPDDMPLTAAAEEEEAGIATGLMEEGDLTGPNRGTEPSPEVLSAEKVAPTPVAPGDEPSVGTTERQPVSEVEVTPAVQEVEQPSVKKVVAKKQESAKEMVEPAQSAEPAVPVLVPAEDAKTKERPLAKSKPAAKVRPAVLANESVKSAPVKSGKTFAPVKGAAKKAALPAKKAVASNIAVKKSVPAKKLPAVTKNAPGKNALAKNASTPAKKIIPPAKKTATANKAAVPAKKVAAPAKKAASLLMKKSSAVKRTAEKSTEKKPAGRKR